MQLNYAVINVNRFDGSVKSNGFKFKLLVANQVSNDFGHYYMVNPANVTFETIIDVKSAATRIGFLKNQKLYLMNLGTSNERISSFDDKTKNHLEYLSNTIDSFVNLKQLLLDAGFIQNSNSINNMSHKEISKNTILNLFS